MKYFGNVYRPPSEAYSFIVQITVGCAHNSCSFCGMYKEKTFFKRELKDVLTDLEEGSRMHPWEKVFLADGDALVYDTEGLISILNYIYAHFPYVKQVSCYATTQDILKKTEEELVTLRKQGLHLLYIGVESGNDEVLRSIKKGVNSEQITQAGIKAKKAGFKTSLTLISGIGSYALSEQHAIDSAKIISLISPNYAAFLTLMVEEDTPMSQQIQNEEFQLISAPDALYEIRNFLDAVDAPGCIFRANHASNYAPLSGTLNRDKRELIETIDQILESHNYKPEWMRRL